MEAALDAFQVRVARRLTERLPRQERDGKWQYPPLTVAIKDAGIVRVRTSVLRRHNTVAQFVATRPILALCEGTEQRGGDTGPPKMVGADWNRLEAGAGAERKKRRRREKGQQQPLQGRQQRRRRRSYRIRKRDQGRRSHWVPVAPAGRNGAGQKIKSYTILPTTGDTRDFFN